MFQIPTAEQWRSLFAVADQIRKAEFWIRFPEELIFTFMNEANKEPFYVTVHGFEEEVLGVSVYRSRDDIQKYLTILSEGDDVSFQTIIACQSCSSVLFGEKEHLGPGDFTAMESAGYHPDTAPNSYIYFRSYQPGLTPWYIGCDDVELLTAGLVSLLEAAKLLGDTTVDADTQTVVYQKQNGEGNVTVSAFDQSLKAPKAFVIKDDFFVARLKRLKRNGRCVEIDICFMNTPVGGNLGPVPFFPKLCVIADVDEGSIADQCIFEEASDEEETFFAFLTQYFNENGLPRKIHIRENTIGYLLTDLCEKLSITLVENKQLGIVDDFLNMVGGFSPEE